MTTSDAVSDATGAVSKPARVKQAPFGVASYSFPVSCGYARRKDKSNLPKFINAYDLADLAAQNNLSSIEIPLDVDMMLPDMSNRSIDAFKHYLDERHLGLMVDTAIVDEDRLSRILPAAARAGAKVIRAVVSGILEGNRYTITQGADPNGSGWGKLTLGGGPTGSNWQVYLDEIRRRVKAVVPLLKEYDLVLALENHQDCTSDELLSFCDIDPNTIGITLDAVNPLAVCEEPYEFARKVGPHIRDVHLKDYTIRATPSGYRLIRAAVGQGVIDWSRMLALIAEVAPQPYLHIELAAIFNRHVRLFEDQWWSSFPPKPMQEIVSALRFFHQHAVPDSVPWQTPWELDGDRAPEETYQYEMAQFAFSVSYLKSLYQAA